MTDRSPAPSRGDKQLRNVLLKKAAMRAYLCNDWPASAAQVWLQVSNGNSNKFRVSYIFVNTTVAFCVYACNSGSSLYLLFSIFKYEEIQRSKRFIRGRTYMYGKEKDIIKSLSEKIYDKKK